MAEEEKEMGNDVRMEFSNERQTWNVFVNGEWYYEGTWEQADQIFCSFFWNDDEPIYDEIFEP